MILERPEDLEEEMGSQPNFSMTKVAEILGITTSTISRAVKRGSIKPVLTDEGKRRIPATEVIGYARKTNKNVEEVAKQVQQETGGSNRQLAKWVLAGIGLYFLLEYISDG